MTGYSQEQRWDHARDHAKHEPRPSDSYEIYCQWCADYGRPAPSRAWWEAMIKRGSAS